MTGSGSGEYADDDLDLLSILGRGNEWLRALLCTLARRGTHLRLRQPERAALLVDALSRWPWFKGGQFLFDLMEWEDFMVDGPPPPVLGNALTAESWTRIAARFQEVQHLLDSSAASTTDALQGLVEGLHAELVDHNDELPELDPGLHLYRDVVLGVVASAGPTLRARRAVRDRLVEGRDDERDE